MRAVNVGVTRPVVANRAQRFVWSHPEWWTVAFSGIAWVTISIPQPHGRHPPSFAAETSMWLVMVVAMMFPLVIGAVRQVAFRSLWRRRHRAMGTFLVGYLGPWFLYGLIVTAIRPAVPTESLGVITLLLIALAIAWRQTALQQRALRACHRVIPLAPHEPRASWDCVRYGWITGVPCVISCWLLMALCAVTGHNLFAMSAATVLVTHDRYRTLPPR